MSTQLKYDKQNEVLTINTDYSKSAINYETLSIFDEKNILLNQRMPEFDFSNPSVDPKQIAGSLKATMKLYGGIGLAANQCGLPFRVFVIGVDDNSIVCFNPVITKYSDTETITNEGCLSFPGYFLKVKRPETIEGYYFDQFGKKIDFAFSGITSKCFQHELDHLNGIKFTKYVGNVSIGLAKKRQKKLMNKFKRQK
jgi:peptide deformylase